MRLAGPLHVPTAAGAASAVTGCATVGSERRSAFPESPSKAFYPHKTQTEYLLEDIPAPTRPVAVVVYGFSDQTEQFNGVDLKLWNFGDRNAGWQLLVEYKGEREGKIDGAAMQHAFHIAPPKSPQEIKRNKTASATSSTRQRCCALRKERVRARIDPGGCAGTVRTRLNTPAAAVEVAASNQRICKARRGCSPDAPRLTELL